jgi:hypothetical protein
MHRHEHGAHMPSHQILHRAGGARVGHVPEIDARRELEQFHGEMLRRAATGRCIGDLAGLALGELDQFTGALDRDGGMHRQHERAGGKLDDRLEAFHRVVGQALGERRVHQKRIDAEQDRMAVGLRASRGGGADIPAGARLVVDNDGLVPPFTQFLADDAREHIGPAARREGNNDEDVSVGQPLSLGQSRCGSRHRQGGEQAPARQDRHRFPPGFLRGCVGAQLLV